MIKNIAQSIALFLQSGLELLRGSPPLVSVSEFFLQIDYTSLRYFGISPGLLSPLPHHDRWSPCIGKSSLRLENTLYKVNKFPPRIFWMQSAPTGVHVEAPEFPPNWFRLNSSAAYKNN